MPLRDSTRKAATGEAGCIACRAGPHASRPIDRSRNAGVVVRVGRRIDDRLGNATQAGEPLYLRRVGVYSNVGAIVRVTVRRPTVGSRLSCVMMTIGMRDCQPKTPRHSLLHVWHTPLCTGRV